MSVVLPAPVLTTQRLLLREFTLADAPFILELVNEPAYMRYIVDRNVRTLEEAAAYLRAGPLASYAQFGFGLWHVSLRATGEPIGKCGLLKRDWLPDPDIGYAILERYHGQGCAREAAQATLDYARKVLGVSRVLATTDPVNDASVALLMKLGFIEQGLVDAPGYDEPARLFAADLTNAAPGAQASILSPDAG